MSFIGTMIGTALAQGMVGLGLGTAAAAGAGAAGAAGAGAGAGLLGAGATSALAGALGQGIAGAGIGALGSAVTGGDVGQGALTGGITGGVLGGIGGLGSSLNAAEGAATATKDIASAEQALKTAKNAIPTSTISGAQSTITPEFASQPASVVSQGGVASQAQSALNQPFTSMNTPANIPTGYAGAGYSPISTETTLGRSLSTAPTSQLATTPSTSAGIFGDRGALSGIGDLAQKYANLGTAGKAATAIGTSMGVNALLPQGSETPSPTEQKSQFAWGGPKYAYSPSSYRPYDITQHRDMFPIYQPSYYAAGGLTDVDGYMSQAQNVNQGMSKGGPSDMGIPNPNEVADPEGYASNSVRMMARGGVARYGIGGDISKVADLAVSTSLPGQIFGWESASELPIVGGLFNDPSRTASLTPEEKKKLMAAAAARNQTVPVQADNNPPQQMARGGIASLGAYSKGGNLLDGPGDGVSDDIPASIENKQPARLARGEYVIPSRIVSELGNGSTDAGAARLDEMVKRIQTGRKKTLKGKDYAKDTKAYKHLPV